VEFDRLAAACAQADILGLEVHAGHGLDYETAAEVLAIPEIRELNIGHFLIGEAVFVGLGAAIWRMRDAMNEAVDGPEEGEPIVIDL
jgi:pyridoxine 5-phosphate synthase